MDPSKSFNVERLQRGLEATAEHANEVGAWSLAILAGSVAVIIGTSYLRPAMLIVRAFYLVFIPGWVLLVLSLYSARDVNAGYLASLLVAEKYLEQTTRCVNLALARQLDYLAVGTFFFALWLVGFLFWWIFSAAPQVESKHRT